MPASAQALDERPLQFSVVLENGRTLTCPTYPNDCTWTAVVLDGIEIHRTNADVLATGANAELTRLADALIPGRRENRELPQPADQDPGEWHECAVAEHDSGRTIRFDPAPDDVDRVRICAPDGEEIAYWSSTEFEEDAPDCLGAAIGALAGGSPTLMRHDQSTAEGGPATEHDIAVGELCPGCGDRLEGGERDRCSECRNEAEGRCRWCGNATNTGW